MGMMTGGELTVRTLMAAGVEHIFGLHGAHIDSIFQACIDYGLPIIDTRQEAGAGHAAEGYARAGRRMGVALVTAGGGFTNVLTPITNAFLDRTPVLFITGSGALRDTETNTLQAGFDQVAMAQPVTKWAIRITATDQIPRLLAQAIRIAQSPPYGPVLVDIPWDVLTEQVSEDLPIPLIGPPIGGPAPLPAMVDRALDIMASAQRPVIVVGSEAKRADAGEALTTLAERSGIPVFADFEGLGLLSRLGERSCGLVQGLYTFGDQGAAPDAVLLLGARFGLNTGHGSGQLLPHDARIVQVDPDSRELGRLQQVELPLIADVGATLEAMAAAALQRDWPDRRPWAEQCAALVRDRLDQVAAQADGRTPLHPFRAVEAIMGHVDGDTIVVADGALTYLWLSEVISGARPRDFLCHGYLGSMGVGMGIALGARVVTGADKGPVILITGDGAVGYALAEFDTMVRQDIPVIVIVLNNRSWGATLHFQQFVAGPNRIKGTRLENGDYHAVATALGADGYEASNIEGLNAALERAISSGRPACINLRVDLDAVPPEELILIGQDPFSALGHNE